MKNIRNSSILYIQESYMFIGNDFCSFYMIKFEFLESSSFRLFFFCRGRLERKNRHRAPSEQRL